MTLTMKVLKPGLIECQVETEQDMQQLAARMAPYTNPGQVIFLNGDLGMGKTTFARGFINQKGYTGIVKSPTYTLVEPYTISDDITCYHFDLYRLSEAEELEFTGARDYFNATSICLVEWPEKAGAFLPDPDLNLKFALDEKGRKVLCEALTPGGEQTMLGLTSDISL